MRPTSVARWGRSTAAAERMKAVFRLRSGRKRQGTAPKGARRLFSGNRKVVFQGFALEK
ncbi:MAG: hypothetical protein IKJ74_01130 [Clostridia bacterium]|nr:hypothetical protein [Clostridia bacterium]